ncbi:MAG: hypothetical protein JSR63_07990 [Proteobacteria bacterium]|nr:hypothetical protein [Pseudomonadota bacterium]
MSNELSGLNGPDFLEAIADQQLSSGLLLDYSEMLRRSKQWREDRATIADLKQELQGAIDRLNAVRNAAGKAVAA